MRSLLIFIGLFSLVSCQKPAVDPYGYVDQQPSVAFTALLSQTNASPDGNMDIYDLILSSNMYIGPATVEVYYIAAPCGMYPYQDVQTIYTTVYAGDNYFAEVKIGEITAVFVNGCQIYNIWQENYDGKIATGKTAQGKHIQVLPKKSEKFTLRL